MTPLKTTIETACQQCGRVFPARRTTRKYCSVHCMNVAHGAVKDFHPVLTKCPACGTEFLPKHEHQKCCSKKCSALRYQCSDQRRQNSRLRYHANKEEIRRKSRERYKTDEKFRAKFVDGMRRRRKENPDQVRAINAKSRAQPAHRLVAARTSREWHSANSGYANPRRIMRKQKERNSLPWKGPVDAAIRRAKEKGLPCDIDYEWAKARWTGRCELSGIPFRVGERGTGPKFFVASIDQIIPKGGYTKENSRFVLWAINAFKYDATDEDVYQVAEALFMRRYFMSKDPLRNVAPIAQVIRQGSPKE
ncbi:MAG: hypothetical protein KGL39_07595 [Patescibacteria group bacterium]|nr:hypothetical protein [Patescibacteria group bacterium]